jgi:hypothetical protein
MCDWIYSGDLGPLDGQFRPRPVLRLNVWYRKIQECDTMSNEQFVQLLTELKQLVFCYRTILVCQISTPVAKIICLLF